MNTDTRLAVSAHILALLSFAPPGKVYTSAVAARSVNTNPVVVRRLMGKLKQSGLITVFRGKGGAALSRPAETITLLDVFNAIVPPGKRCPFELHQNPSPRCFIGKNIHDALEMPLAKARSALQESLATTTIADIAAFIRARRENETD
ncbi:Transcriptional regulator [uncultured delta proteobacterium]|uniref:Transcriptional regulator n=1 Tax=uncultured delta proteobacterium TaxID=34034 RepID=A0A212JZP6_9DELT|nr:Transcriptional regulator [uncultured delta proteobacterium]